MQMLLLQLRREEGRHLRKSLSKTKDKKPQAQKKNESEGKGKKLPTKVRQKETMKRKREESSPDLFDESDFVSDKGPCSSRSKRKDGKELA
ncbi:hypothetical protein H5410_003206 [Solanum commersonii]|uniref:Uncharacterized protein n=1 Tax=Solanum commersonii TaxID=4109 RepID=A0A9J6B458_SOLCO|nr:hypothetical protein H5410_003206 [Solanum commersonii]